MLILNLPPANEVWGKVVFQKRLSVILSTRGRVCLQGVCLGGIGLTPHPPEIRKAGGPHPPEMLSCFKIDKYS